MTIEYHVSTYLDIIFTVAEHQIHIWYRNSHVIQKHLP
jgi:hypothetical protein